MSRVNRIQTLIPSSGYFIPGGGEGCKANGNLVCSLTLLKVEYYITSVLMCLHMGIGACFILVPGVISINIL